MSDSMRHLEDREDLAATTDPALQAGADRGEVNLLSYNELYRIWERQQWSVYELDFSQDRIDWHERIPPDERLQRMYGFGPLLIGEQRVEAELGPMMRAMPDEDMRIFLSTQIADEARHVAFFNRFYKEVGVVGADSLQGRRGETSARLNPKFRELFDEMLRSRVDRLAVDPEDLETLVEAVTLYHMVIEGMLALTGQHFIIDFNERQGTLPAFVQGFTLVARDEHRHVAFGARFLRDMARRDPRPTEAIQRTLAGGGAGAAGGVRRPGARGGGAAEVVGGGRRRADAVRRLGRRDAGVRDEGARAPDEGDR